jgi:hypothetical protein
MYTNKIGCSSSLFWIAWAYVAEKTENYKFADQIFNEGCRHNAEPKDLLQKRYHQFQRRMTRHFLNHDEVSGTNESSFLSCMESSIRPINGKFADKPAVPTASNPSHSLGFDIFCDSSSNNQVSIAQSTGWTILPAEKEAKKENEGAF